MSIEWRITAFTLVENDVSYFFKLLLKLNVLGKVFACSNCKLVITRDISHVLDYVKNHKKIRS